MTISASYTTPGDSISPSVASRFKAPRTGDRLTPDELASDSSFMLSSGRNVNEVAISRMRWL